MIHNQSSAEVQHNSKTQAEPSLDVQTTYDLNDKSLLIAHNNHFVRPSKLFKTPENVRFKQKRKPSSMKEADHVLVSGQVYLR
jgi:hypothetical protein